MKLKTKQEIENLADSEHRHLNIARKVWTFKDGYKSGYTQAQKDLLESASNGFEEKFGEEPKDEDSWDWANRKLGWYAAVINTSKKYEARIEELEQKLKEAREL